MDAYVANISKNSIAFGLRWAVLPGVERTRKEIKKLAQEAGAASYVSLPNPGDRPKIGTLSDRAYVDKGASRTSASSAAAILSLAYRDELKNAIFGIRLTTSRVSLIAFKNGYPLIGYDLVVTVEQIDDKVSSYLQEVGADEVATVKFYGDAELFAGRVVSAFSKDALFGAVDKKTLASARLRRAKSRLVMWLLILAGLAGAGVAVDHYLTQQQQAAVKAIPVAIDPNALYKQSASAYLAAVGYQSGFVAGTVVGQINRLPVFHAGWRIQSGSCKPTTEAIACILTWANTDGGTFQSFGSSGLPGLPAYRTEYKEGMTTLDTLFEIPFKAPRGLKIEHLVTKDQFSISYGSTAQTMKGAGLTVSFTKPTIVALPPTPVGAQPITEAGLKEPVREGSWTMAGDWMFYSSLTNMPANMTLEAIDLSVSGELISMNASGRYYVKN
jgi:hypothetical protein